MTDLVITKFNDVETIDSRIVANELGIKHKNLIELIRTHQKSIESNFNLVAFETEARLEGKHGGGDLIIAHLTEDQSIFVGSLSRNTEKVVEFKAKIVKAFSEARKPKELSRKELALMVVKAEEEKEQLLLQVDNLSTALDSLVEWVSIIKVATKNKIKETAINWRLLKRKSEEMGYAIKKAQSPRFDFQNLYHINVFRACYPQFNYEMLN
jgi:phage regulator Rha-like protein